MKSKIISVCNEKGGVGKTTTAFNLAAALTAKGKKVLAIDLDQQGNLSSYLGHAKDGNPTITDCIYSTVAELTMDYDKLIRHNDEGIDYIPSSKNLSSINSIISSDEDSNYVLRRALSNDVFDNYDYIIIDCQTLLDLLVANALNASNYVIIPVQAENWSYQGADKMIGKIQGLQRTTNPNLRIGGILVTMSSRTNMAAMVEESLRNSFKGLVFDTTIPRLAEAGRNTLESRSLINRKSSRIGQAYSAMTDEFITRTKEVEDIE